MAVSTPSDIVLHYYDQEKRKTKPVVFEGGSHGILATPSGRFFAPLGIDGLLQIKPEPDVPLRPNFHCARGRVLDFYSAVLLPPAEPRTLLACATRRDGITAVSIPQGDAGGSIRMIQCGGIDVVDVCALGRPDWQRAAAAVGRDCSVLLMKDVLGDGGPLLVNFPGMRGNAYRILSAEGHLFILTSEFLYVLPDLVTRFLRGEELGQATPVRAIQLKAVNAYMAYERWLLVITPTSVYSSDIHTLLGASPPVPPGQRPHDEVLSELVTESTPVATRPEPAYEEFEMTSELFASAQR
jgi:hypothetical protein